MFGQTRRHCTNTFELRERDRIKKKKEKVDRHAELESINNFMQRAEYLEAESARALMHQGRVQSRETHLAHTALTLVRREALRRLLEQERQLYNTELSQRGLAIYKQRI
ncbi:cilia- and flagella-associated protein 141-like [Hoplias malabaricus]|uniref:cilia- and flagella-associated protein 141-like n=1 Tax=Hoplias malabaricus TaxID=27720 RepID=UPI0034634720